MEGERPREPNDKLVRDLTAKTPGTPSYFRVIFAERENKRNTAPYFLRAARKKWAPGWATAPTGHRPVERTDRQVCRRYEGVDEGAV